jgi:hypothetical protein
VVSLVAVGCGPAAPDRCASCAVDAGVRRVVAFDEWSARVTDVLVVLDPSVGPANFPAGAERLRALFEVIAQAPRVDYHLALVSGVTDGLLPAAQRCGIDGAFATSAPICGQPGNLGRGLAETLECLARAIPVEESHQPLEAMRRALKSPAARAFLRGRQLAVILLSANDDDSRDQNGQPIPVTDYVDFLSSLSTPEWKVQGSIVAPPSAPRLSAFAGAFSSFSFGDVTTPDWRWAADFPGPLPTFPQIVCLPSSFLDDAGAALRAGCDVREVSPGEGSLESRALPPCSTNGAEPCYELIRDDICPSSTKLGILRPGVCLPPAGTKVATACPETMDCEHDPNCLRDGP